MASHKLRKILAPVLFPLALLYGFATSVRNKLYNLGILKSTEFDFPVISVGNITVGGTGKTPHVEYLLDLLGDKFEVAFLSRGYKRKTKGFILANGNSSPETIGDEPFQIFRKYKHVKIAVDENRVHGIEELMNTEKPPRCVILDDAYQHRRVAPGVNIALIDYHRPMHRDYLLPLGDLRESKYGIHRANIVIVTKVPHEIKPIEKRLWIKELNLFPYQFLYFTAVHYGNLIPVFNTRKKQIKLEEISQNEYAVVLITGIANPLPLAQKVMMHCKELEEMQFPDHYEYTSRDINKILLKLQTLKAKNKLVITTEKDAVKLRCLKAVHDALKDNIYYIPVKIRFLDEKGKEFDSNIYEFVRKNKKISRLHC